MKIKQYAVSRNLRAYIDQTSLISEAYRSLRTNIQYSSVDKKIKSILITSPMSQDGKTVTACNLAIVMANADNKTLLIDADLRKPNIHNQFYLKNYNGLANLLLNKCTLEEAIQKIKDLNNLDILTSGIIPPNPVEMINSKRMKDFFNEVYNAYDSIIIDSPPIGFVSDGLIISKLVDGVILNIALGKTNINLSKQAAKDLRSVNANILGVVVTKNKKNAYGKEYLYSNL